jgi:transposase
MEEHHTKLRVVGHDRGGRCRYDAASKRALIEACLRPGVSVARTAQENGINANLLRKWMTRYLLERERGLVNVTPAERIPDQQTPSPSTVDAMPIPSMPRAAEIAPAAFVPIVVTGPGPVAASSAPPASSSVTMDLHVRLPNGVHFDLGQASLQAVSDVVHLLGRLPCSGSTQD